MNELVGSSITVTHGGLCGSGGGGGVGGGRIWENFVWFVLNLSCLVCEKIWESENGMFLNWKLFVENTVEKN